MTKSLRLKLVAAAILAGSVAAGLGVACGSSDDAPSGCVCSGDSCDGGAGFGDGTAPDAPVLPPDGAATDGGPADAGVDAPPDGPCPPGAPGSLDTTFGDGGLVVLKYPGSHAYGVAIQPDGKTVIGGLTQGAKGSLAAVRLLSEGSLDPSFGAGGLVETFPGDRGNIGWAVALQPDGKVIVAGSAGFNTLARPDLALVRYTTSGALDPTFGTGGVVLLDFGGATDVAVAVAVQPDGRIVAGGYSEKTDFASADYALARFTSTGALDPTFGVGGKVTIDVRGTGDDVQAMTLTADGRILIGGSSRGTTAVSDPNRMSILRLSPNGTLDPTWGDAGKLLFPDPNMPLVGGLAIDSAGRAIVSGYYLKDIAVLRLLPPSGAPDPSFGDAGVARTSFGPDAYYSASVLVQEDGKIVAVGGGPNSLSFALARHLPDGIPDPAFGDGGRVLTPIPAFANSGGGGRGAISRCFVTVAGGLGYETGGLGHSAMLIARYNR